MCQVPLWLMGWPQQVQAGGREGAPQSLRRPPRQPPVHVGSWPTVPVQFLSVKGEGLPSPRSLLPASRAPFPQLRLVGPLLAASSARRTARFSCPRKADPAARVRHLIPAEAGGTQVAGGPSAGSLSRPSQSPSWARQGRSRSGPGPGRRLPATPFVFLKPRVLNLFHTIGLLKRMVNLNPVGFHGAV